MTKVKLCTIKNKLQAIKVAFAEKFFQQFGFRIQDVSLENIERYFFAPKDSSSLSVTRILFGLSMLCDIPEERGGAALAERWGPGTCHFPLLPFVRAAPLPYMALVYAALWLGALGMTLGYRYRASAAAFVLSYWYLLLVEKSYWNNHSYLFGVVALLLATTDAHCYWSIDAIKNPSIRKETVPYWNYFVLKYQFFILYFMAGVKKGTAEWLSGYSVQNLSEHWVFSPFRLFLTVPQTDYLVVHWFVFAFDLTVAGWMMWGRSRHAAMLLCALFHLMNSRLFSIGMFPWVCLATMPLFYPFDWPKTLGTILYSHFLKIKKEACKRLNYIQNVTTITFDDQTTEKNEACVEELSKDHRNKDNEEASNGFNEETNDNFETAQKNLNMNDSEQGKGAIISDEVRECNKVSKSSDNELSCLVGKEKCLRRITITLISFLVVTQAFLPFSHFITQGYNNWTNGLYGYSWDMMVHTWETNSVVVKIVDNDNNTEFYVDPYLYAPNDRWTRHGDMLYQYAHCIKDNLISQTKKYRNSKTALSSNLSIYVDVWCSMNGRFTQRMFDSNADLLNASWSPFEPVSYLMPLLDEALAWRGTLQDMRQEVHSWHNASDVIFIADFPGYVQEKYIPIDIDNVTLTVLEGVVAFEPELTSTLDGQSYQLKTGNKVKLNNGIFHKILNIGETPAYYMYTFVNTSNFSNVTKSPPSKLPVAKELSRRITNMFIFMHSVISNILQLLYNITKCQQI